LGIKAVIWDLGGVLVRTEDRSAREQWEQRLGLEVGELDAMVFEGKVGRAAALGKAQADDIWRSLGQQLNLDKKELARLREDFWAGDRVDHQLIEKTRALRPHRKTALLSNAWPDLRRALEETWGIADVFDEIIISAEVGFAKPDPRIYQLMLERLTLEAGEVVFIDDFKHNIEAADQLGLNTIHFTNASEVFALLETLLKND
jgi:epoxide hydrolase-like predicted phosphatase